MTRYRSMRLSWPSQSCVAIESTKQQDSGWFSVLLVSASLLGASCCTSHCGPKLPYDIGIRAGSSGP